jgi:transposase
VARPLLTDALWTRVQPLLPEPKPRRQRYPGRKRLDDRSCLTGVLLVLKMDIPWEHLPQELNCGSGMTCWRRLREWQESGHWGAMRDLLMDHFDGNQRINWKRAPAETRNPNRHTRKRRPRIVHIACRVEDRPRRYRQRKKSEAVSRLEYVPGYAPRRQPEVGTGT